MAEPFKKEENPEWYTPEWIFKNLHLRFDLDPCSIKDGVPWIPVEEWYYQEQDGLNKEWKGKVWLNPPFGKDTAVWLEKMHQHRNGVALLFARTDRSYFYSHVAQADAILFLKGRIKFVTQSGEVSKTDTGCGSMLVAWGEENVKALERMKSFGFFTRITEHKKLQPTLF